jgi:hypothetical protein
MSELIYRLLAICARVELTAIHQRQIADAAQQVTNWDDFPALAQAHSLAPLAHKHLRAVNITLPRTVKRELDALATRQRYASQIRMRALGELVRQFQSADIQVVVLKGAALENILYREPGLRPMSDIDLLVHRADLGRAQQLLGAIGFSAPMTFPGHAGEHRHLSTATKIVEGYPIGVELHHNLFEPEASPILMSIPDLTCPPISFSLGADGTVGWTLGYEDMLWHLCQHLIESTNILSSICLIWVADIVSFVERFTEQIAWDRIKTQYPIVLNTLSLLHFLTPLSDVVIRQAQLNLGKEPVGMWDDFRKPPRITPEEQMGKGYAETIRNGITPTEWWLRLHYGLGSVQPITWHHRLSHLIYLSKRFARVQQRNLRLNQFSTRLI